MNIILVSGDLAKVRTLTVTRSQLMLLGTGLLVALALAAAGLQYLLLRHAAQSRSEMLQPLLASVAEEQQRHTESYVRGNLNAMAIRLGQMQAQLLRLDSLGERLAKLSGLKPGEFLFEQLPGRGGSVSALPAQDVTLPALARQMDELARQVDDRFDKLGVLESLVMHERLTKKMLPSIPPVANGWYSSGFGWRIDPFTGRNTFHEGVDFNAETGTAIAAAAGGIVVYAERHPEYGNMVEVDHGNDLATRYAHASRLLVKAGDVVLRGQKIAEVGNTGRSTGTHLHFEVRHRGVPQNPSRFLQARN